MSAAESFKSYCNQFRLAQSPFAVCYAVNDVRARADDILKYHNSEIPQQNRVIKVLLIQSEVEDFLKAKCSNLIGRVEGQIFLKFLLLQM